MQASILISTWKRVRTLATTLDAFARMDTAGLAWELLIADNGPDEDTQALLREYAVRLPLTWIVEERRGKNFALNSLLPLARGGLYVFSDDDVIPKPDWLRRLIDGAARWPNATFFTGRIRPSCDIPFDLSNNFVRCAYMVADWAQEEGVIRPDSVWGPNMAVRPVVFAGGERFDTSIGPNGTEYAMGSEVEFTLRMARRGHLAVYLPDAEVTHIIREQQLTETWLFQRVFRSGRGVVRLGEPYRGPKWFGKPRYLYRETLDASIRALAWRILGDRDRRVAAELDYWHARGKLFEIGVVQREARGDG